MKTLKDVKNEVAGAWDAAKTGKPIGYLSNTMAQAALKLAAAEIAELTAGKAPSAAAPVAASPAIVAKPAAAAPTVAPVSVARPAAPKPATEAPAPKPTATAPTSQARPLFGLDRATAAHQGKAMTPAAPPVLTGLDRAIQLHTENPKAPTTSAPSSKVDLSGLSGLEKAQAIHRQQAEARKK